ncbi:putative metallopeptidase family m24 protein [Botrytis fragariae]|uniref:Xaa-Pro aminopeptidase n=1 Tax=Botrytis fragariae TaxID=1964551 RepID=A0A8H6AQA4_9HELO|nr:putative metallopeptidase family m24 protein [Botrytis fragariae]KAF5871528.1 putative metallopeptidase family m24 protein [Botrytis fragariae]
MKCSRRTRTLFQQLEGTSGSRGISSSSIVSSRPRCQAQVSSAATKCHTTYQSRRTYASISASELQFGQPVHETHPHLLNAGEVTPGISAQEYADRRADFAAKLPPNAIAILRGADIKYRSGAVFHEFHQQSNFFYLTGFNEPEAIAVIQKLESSEFIFHLFVRPKDPQAELWDGARSGEQAALDVFNADESGDVNQAASYLRPLIEGASEIYMDVKESFLGGTLDSIQGVMKQKDLMQLFRDAKAKKSKPIGPLINDLRAIKSEAEIKNMRKAGKISGRSFTNAMRKRWTEEKHLGAFLDFDFKIGGCEKNAYVPVIGGGRNAQSIHYVSNNDVLRDGELVLVDAGGQYGGYITDITRTWPINGKFTDAQKDLYEALLKVQRSSVALCRESSNMTLDKIHAVTRNGLTDQLKQLGFDMSGNAIDTLFPHHVGHYIGLDVHDTPGYSRSNLLKEGHCITIEPGVYVPNDERWPAHFRGMGIRIEDSVCIQEDSPLVLTTEAVKEVVDIEALRD